MYYINAKYRISEMRLKHSYIFQYAVGYVCNMRLCFDVTTGLWIHLVQLGNTCLFVCLYVCMYVCTSLFILSVVFVTLFTMSLVFRMLSHQMPVCLFNWLGVIFTCL